MTLLQCIYLFMTALFSALIMVPFLHRWALSSGAVDAPDSRKIHRQPVPRIGGIAIFMALLFATLVYVEMEHQMRGILAGGLILFFTGLIDDLYGISPRRKFLGEVSAAVIAMGVGNLAITRLGDLFVTGPITLPLWAAIPFTLFAIVGVINAINLIDGLDGLAGGVSIIALSAFFVLAFHDQNLPALALCAAGLGAILGFLKYNFYPARIFMGDTGSLVVGFILACIAISLTQGPYGNVNPAIPLMILGLPISDTLFVMGRRVMQKKSPFSADMGHVHHKILNLGFQHRFTVLILYGISFFWAIFSILFHQWPAYRLLSTFLLISALSYLGLKHLHKHRDRYNFLLVDSSRGIRDSVLYRRFSEKADILIPVILGLFILYLGLAALGVLHFRFHAQWPAAGVLFLAIVGLFAITRDAGNHFLLSLLYFACLIITFSVEPNGQQLVVGDFSLKYLSNILFGIMSFLILFKVIFRKDGEHFLSSVDLLLMAVSILLSVLFYRGPESTPLAVPFLKGIVLFLAVKVVSGGSRLQGGVAVASILGLLLTIMVKGYFS